MTQSRSTWKALERRTAKDIGGHRNGNMGTATVDAENEMFGIECKSWSELPARVTAALGQAERNAKPGQVPIARIHKVGQRGGNDLCVMRWSTFIDLTGGNKDGGDGELRSEATQKSSSAE